MKCVSSLCLLQHIDYCLNYCVITSVYKNLHYKHIKAKIIIQSIQNSAFIKKKSLCDQTFSHRESLLYQTKNDPHFLFFQSPLVRTKRYDWTSQFFLFCLCVKNEDITSTQKCHLLTHLHLLLGKHLKSQCSHKAVPHVALRPDNKKLFTHSFASFFKCRKNTHWH